MIERAIETLKDTLVEELIIVSIVIMIFLWHIPSALVPMRFLQHIIQHVQTASVSDLRKADLSSAGRAVVALEREQAKVTCRWDCRVTYPQVQVTYRLENCSLPKYTNSLEAVETCR